VNAEIKLSPIGEIVQREWCNISSRFLDVELDAFVIMPNHLHGIMNVGAPLDNAIVQNNRAGTSPAPTLGDMVGSFKSLCIYNCRNDGSTTGKFWQRNYYEHVIRNEDELNRIREYIVNNPLQWEKDENNPMNW
jgi:REP element-mobilizing transposase RayT